MTREILNYIRKHKYIYNYLRENSEEYIFLYRDNRYIKEIKRKAKERYKLRYIDKIDNISNKISIINTLIDVIK